MQGLPETESKILSETVASEYKIPDSDRIEDEKAKAIKSSGCTFETNFSFKT